MTFAIPDDAAPLFAAVTSRHSVRGFLDEAVPRSVIEMILAAASRAASGNNTQPWKVHVLTGNARARLTAAIMEHRATEAEEPPADYRYYPETWPEPYLSRRRKLGWDLYRIVGVAKGDREASRRWHDENFRFFGAPVGLIFTMDRRLGMGSYIDLGMFMQNIMTLARGLGFDTCPQAAFTHYPDIIRRQLDLPGLDMVMCGMALGRADTASPVNGLKTDREPVSSFARFHGE